MSDDKSDKPNFSFGFGFGGHPVQTIPLQSRRHVAASPTITGYQNEKPMPRRPPEELAEMRRLTLGLLPLYPETLGEVVLRLGGRVLPQDTALESEESSIRIHEAYVFDRPLNQDEIRELTEAGMRELGARAPWSR